MVMRPLNLPKDPKLEEQRRRELGLPVLTGIADPNERATMQMFDRLQPIRPEYNFMLARAEELDGRPKLQSVAGGSTTPVPPQAGLLSRVGRRVMDTLQDPVANAQLLAAVNTLRFNPDDGLVQMAQQRAETVQASRDTARLGNASIQQLRSMGRDDLAQLVKLDPSMAKDALSIAYGVGGVSDKFFAPKVDPVTGKEYVTRVNPNTGEVQIVYTGGKQLTPQEEFDLENKATLRLQDQTKAQDMGADAMATYDQIIDDINSLEQALAAVKANPNVTGLITSKLPSLTQSAFLFDQAARKLGLGVVAGTTFGALSQGELNLAMSTNIDANLRPAEQIKALETMLQLRRRMADAMFKKAQTLSRGEIGYGEWIESLRSEGVIDGTQQAPATAAPMTGAATAPPPLSSSASSYL